MKRATILGLTALLSAFAAVTFAIYIPPTHYDAPPKAEKKHDWPEGLAAVIADKNYVDGWSYANPGYVVEMNDTFFYDGDAAALGKFIHKLRELKNLDVKVSFTRAAGRAYESLRAGIVIDGKALGQDIDKLGGKPCSWLVTVTDKRWAEHAGAGTNAQARVLIFLGSSKINLEQLEL